MLIFLSNFIQKLFIRFYLSTLFIKCFELPKKSAQAVVIHYDDLKFLNEHPMLHKIRGLIQARDFSVLLTTGFF